MKESAMAACADEHLALLACMRNQSSLALIWGQSEECRAKHAAFWECYGRHRGVRGNRIAAWLAQPCYGRLRGVRGNRIAAWLAQPVLSTGAEEGGREDGGGDERRLEKEH
ncbi:unnamed protein product [Closterium sp. Naga37s-1]|nr:unnamed protein product [Closterium sp. Naga37s-1]